MCPGIPRGVGRQHMVLGGCFFHKTFVKVRFPNTAFIIRRLSQPYSPELMHDPTRWNYKCIDFRLDGIPGELLGVVTS